MTTRQPLPQRRQSATFAVAFWNRIWHVTVGFYQDNRPGEVFINAAKSPGTELEAMCRDAAILLSLALQYGVPIDVIKGALTRNPNGAPSAITGAIVDRPEMNFTM